MICIKLIFYLITLVTNITISYFLFIGDDCNARGNCLYSGATVENPCNKTIKTCGLGDCYGLMCEELNNCDKAIISRPKNPKLNIDTITVKVLSFVQFLSISVIIGIFIYRNIRKYQNKNNKPNIDTTTDWDSWPSHTYIKGNNGNSSDEYVAK